VRFPFGKRKPDFPDNLLHELDARFRRIELLLDRPPPQAAQITIENVHIHQPVLEKMEYRLDALDIEHLSGSLNLGNNFGAKFGPEPQAVKPPTASKPAPPAASSGQTQTNPAEAAQQTDSTVPGLHRTSTGFRLRRS
jgi:hypothetical protein